MEISYSLTDLMLHFFLYSFLGWAAEVLCFTIWDKQFINRGFLNVPFALPYGVTAVILIVVLPTLNGKLLFQYIQCLIVYWAVTRITEQVVRGIRRERKHSKTEPGKKQKILEFGIMAIIAGAYLIVYLIIHPLISGLSLLLPDLLIRIFVIACAVVVLMDLDQFKNAWAEADPLSRSVLAALAESGDFETMDKPWRKYMLAVRSYLLQMGLIDEHAKSLRQLAAEMEGDADEIYS